MSQPPRQSGHSGSAPGAALIPKLSSDARDAHPSYHSDPGVVLVLVDPALTPILCGVEATRPIKCLSAGLPFLRTRGHLTTLRQYNESALCTPAPAQKTRNDSRVC
jgi:hypothetical protein